MLKVKVNGEKETIINFDDDSLKSGKIGNKKFNWDLKLIDKECSYYHIIKDNLSYNTSVLDFDPETKSFVISVRGNVYKVSVKDEYDELLSNLGIDVAATKKASDVKAPMPGLVKEIQVNANDEVVIGQSLFVLEAMKMENIIKSPVDGVIKSIEVKQETAVEKNQVLLKFK
ncbi:MAG: acetyl-CoA carboxylase biotin carboxyl carrier protein subunit [Bacteroidetes bacterium]|nr:acetyl-CoA carboxylase biotin carboxyl carrier protein subunit [Bacteroidota bacterium]MBT5531007.1 acetyl-CoA carboxylase biotin carboxyl carrier protein subunit [Cytophagia bacterium]MBT7827185.1 acetyl-CoA carboxylase biotin carboxyl carrier protein subunit [Bacteroidota bacterium]